MSISKQFSPQRLGRVREVLTGYVERGEVPGIVAGVSRRGETHVEAVGAKAIGGDPVARDTIFRIASMTKPITAAAAMILVEECTLRLDDPVDALLPEFANRRVLRQLDGSLDDTVAAQRSITLRDLLTFRLGFGMVLAMPGTYPIQVVVDALDLFHGPPMPSRPPEPDEWMRRFGTLPLIHQPGEQWMYHSGSDVLGVLIARATGQPFESFLRERIFEPLGMRDTGFCVAPADIDRFATSYSIDPTTSAFVVFDEPTGQWSRPPAFPSGGGGLVSTIDDYLKFSTMMLNKGKYGKVRILSRPTVETMTIDHLTPQQKAASTFSPGFFDAAGWGFGMSVVTRRDAPSAPVGSYGWTGGLGTMWNVDPSEELSTIILTQRMMTSPQPPPVFLDFLTSTYQAIDD